MKNTYRVLMTRGLKGCYVTFLDPATEAFVRSRLETDRPVAAPLAVEPEEAAVPVGGTDPRLERLTKLGMEIWPLFEPVVKVTGPDKGNRSATPVRSWHAAGFGLSQLSRVCSTRCRSAVTSASQRSFHPCGVRVRTSEQVEMRSSTSRK